jgi:predicted DNA-binding transcriptional regulator AlpA
VITTLPSEFLQQIRSHPGFTRMVPVSEKPRAPAIRKWPGMMSLSTLADYLDVSVSTVSTMVKNGQLPPPTIAPTPRLKRWSRQSVDEYFQRASEKEINGPSIDDLMAKSTMTKRGGY